MKLRKHFTLKGRISIAAYWQTIAVAAMAYALVYILLPTEPFEEGSTTTIILWLLCLALSLGSAWLYIAATVKRLHDTGRQATYLLWLIALCLGALILMFICGWSEGQYRSNRYGEPPR